MYIECIAKTSRMKNWWKTDNEWNTAISEQTVCRKDSLGCIPLPVEQWCLMGVVGEFVVGQ